MMEMQNILVEVGHVVSAAHKKHVILRVHRPEFSMTVGVVRATSSTLKDAMGLLVIREKS